MSDTTRNIFAGSVLVGLFMLFYLILMGVIWIVKGVDAVATALDYSFYIFVAVLIAVFLFAIVLVVARIFNMATRNIIEFQANDDRGEIVRMAMRNLGQSDKQAMQQASRMAIQQSNAIVRASQRQLPTVQEPEQEYTDFWPLPQLEDNGD